jgi:hypothetical protein
MTINTIIQPKSKKLLFLTLTLLLTSCGDEPPTDEQRGVYTAKSTRHDITYEYLQCYALNAEEKRQCIDPLNAQYPNHHGKESQEYIKAYQFESEKLGFKHFLNNLNLKCEKIEEGPLFVEEKQAYLVKCKPKNQYLMRFDYESNQWQLIIDGGDHE